MGAPGELPETEALSEAFFDAAGVLCGVFALEGDDYRYVLANPAAAAFYGMSPESLIGRTGRDMGLSTELLRTRMDVFMAVWREQRSMRREYRFEHAGRSGWFLGSFTPLKGPIPRVGFVLVDITAQKAAERTAAEQGRKLQVAVQSAEMGFWEFDIRRDVVAWDDRMRELFAVDEAAPVDFALYESLLYPADRALVRAAIDAAMRGEGGGRFAVVHRVGDGARWIRGSGQVLFDREGRPRRMLGTARDVTAERTAREQEQLLLAELNHRVKNNLATVQSLALQTARNSPDVAAFVETFQGRLLALARTHDVLTARAWGEADVAEVIARETDLFGDRVRLTGPPAPLAATQALALGMVVHELSTNAAKHGALSTPAGRVEVAWRFDGAHGMLDWTEIGGPPCPSVRTEGFGSRLMQRLGRGDLRGDLVMDFRPGGLAARVTWSA